MAVDDERFAVLRDLPFKVRAEIADLLEQDKPIGAIYALRDAIGFENIGIADGKKVIDGVRELSDEDRKAILERP
ncbi:hypothetical protein CQY20_06850 [Mycolicibacterium agri]|uniref:Uncharacterized protein n=1 Tax=Mycolicibacterium agri TaxID=36811 RepID=A0A2A7N9S1_MYCAG|nr:hypothetical protein [Mycolicibacterium agri]PEG40644.1 hypothetical protein CQY20_06850 [Mycolicibacterium agri]GFG50390.1 hypothetical protein MAGR_18310 [Mycolicibacterium agri]